MKNTNKNFSKFTSRSQLRQKRKNALLKAVEETGVGARAVKVKFTEQPYPRRSQKSDIYAEGIFRESRSGYGFVTVEGLERDIFIPESNVGAAIGGDTVAIKYHSFFSALGEEKTEGRITEILEYGKKTVVGTVDNDVVRIGRRRVNRLFIDVDDSMIKRRIFVRDDGGAVPGDRVMAKLIRGGVYSYEMTADIVSVFGNAESKEANYLSILEECEIDTDFSTEELRQAEQAAREPICDDGRVVRNEIIFTIDSESAKDLDDAISLKVNSDGTYTLGVHIADVSHYVKEKTALDRLVTARGTSVYFTDKVVPMLPESLSNGACSLNPGEKKYTLSAIITLSEGGDIIGCDIERSIIVSKIKGIYSEINEIWSGEANDSLVAKYGECLDTLRDMRKLYELLAKKARARGYVELESPEAEILLDGNGAVLDIVKRERGDAEKMIEQFMLTANEAVATLLFNAGIPCVYRVHEDPPKDKFSEFLTYASNLGLDSYKINADNCQPRELAELIEEASERGIGEAVSYACLRAMSKAAYSDVRRRHFGLGIENYCHFTSPIRRLSDLATHRIINKVIFEGKAKEKYKSYAKRAAAAATDAELRAQNAERRIENLYKVIYMKERVGEIFEATVSSVATFGIFATLENTCEGLIPMSTLEGSFVYDEKNLTVRDNKTFYRIGDRLSVRLEEADMTTGKLRFSLLGKIC
ncbi:MAG: VacB/RNase II family 3'-5' exoribonuclease [Ruminococcaceae bacterium]|nr:VacB/RNase II family 3'-5' exoribonuclease [Oscillospiraceae bacterium]